MENIKEIISELTQTRFKHEMEGLKVLEQWEAIAGSRLYALSRPVSIRNGTLFVFVENSVALQEMSYNKQNILKNINTKKDLPYIKDIKFNIRSNDHTLDIDEQQAG
jgi:hypothetical protein